MSYTPLSSAIISDGKGGKTTVLPGDQVELIDPKNQSTRNFLGFDGPYTVSWIVHWDCGRESFYMRTDDGETGGVYTSEFKACTGRS